MSPDDELNDITFNAVGRGTTVDYIQARQNSDDGIEFFNGAVNVKHVFLTYNQEDAVGWAAEVQDVRG